MDDQTTIPQESGQKLTDINERSQNTLDESKRTCWVCFATDEDDEGFPWVKPCNCKGTTKWVHQACLQRWVDEKQKGNTAAKVTCPQCNFEYVIIYPNMGFIVVLMDQLDQFIYKACPFLAAGLLVCSVYWTAVTYGAITVMQVCGHDEGIEMMNNTHSIVLIIGLPAIPLMLISGKLFRWEETVLTFLRRYTPKIPVLKYVLPSFVYEEPFENSYTNANTNVQSLNDTICATKLLCSALLLPTISAVVGGLFFESVPSKIQRTLLGGITFIAVKGLFRIYHKQKKFIQKNKRKILDRSKDIGT